MRSYYLLDPVLYNDLILFADGTRYVLRSLNLSPEIYIGAPLLLVAAGALLYGANRILMGGIEPKRLNRATRAALVTLVVASLAPLLLADAEVDAPQRAVTSFTNKMGANLSRSVTALETAGRYAAAAESSFYAFTESDLAEKPDIYLIFIESYGSVLYQRDDFHFMYGLWLKLLERRLDTAGRPHPIAARPRPGAAVPGFPTPPCSAGCASTRRPATWLFSISIGPNRIPT